MRHPIRLDRHHVPLLERQPLRGADDDLGRDLAANDQREDYLRARLEQRADGSLIAVPVNQQDSSLLGNLAAARALVVRPPFAPAAVKGDPCEFLRLPE